MSTSILKDLSRACSSCIVWVELTLASGCICVRYKVFVGTMLGGSMVYFVPFSHIVKLALDRGLDKAQGGWIVLVLGVCNTAGRLVAGCISDKFGRLETWQFSLVFAGAALVALPFCPDSGDLPLYWIMVFTGIFGFWGGAFIAMFGVLLADLFGVNRVASAMGMSMCFQTIGMFIGPPAAGLMREVTGDYRLPYAVSGVLFAVCGIAIGAVKKYLKHPEHLRQLELFEGSVELKKMMTVAKAATKFKKPVREKREVEAQDDNAKNDEPQPQPELSASEQALAAQMERQQSLQPTKQP